jgi:hypothetical protein
MSRKFLVDGQEIEVDDQDVNAFMDEVNAAGKKVEAAQAPEYAPKPRTGLDTVKETGQDMALGAAHGLSFGFDDDALELLAGESTANEYRAAGERARGRSPIGYHGSDIAASLLSPVGKIGAIGKMGMVARGLTEGAIEGGLRAYGDTDKDSSPLEQLYDTGRGAVLGGATGGLFGAGGQVVKNVMHGTPGTPTEAATEGAAKWLNDKASINRVAATGVYGSGLKRFMQNHGEDSVIQLGEDIERAGLHKSNYPGGKWNPLNHVGADARTYADNAGALLDDAGNRMGQYEDDIANLASPPTVPLDDLTGQLRDRADLRSRAWDPAGTSEANFATKYADRIDRNTNAVMKPDGSEAHYAEWPDAMEQRRYTDSQIDWNRLGGGPEAPMEESVRRFIAGDLRAGTKDALQRGVSNGTVPPELNAGWNGANNDFRLGAAVHDPAVARVYQEYGNQKISLPSWIAASSQENPLRGGLMGMAADFVKYRGASTLAAGQRGLANKAESLGVLAEEATPTVARAFGAQAPGLPFGPNSASERSNRARGWQNSRATETLIKQSPNVLGKWGKQLAEAADDDRLNAELLRLSQTDPEFRLQVLPHIESLTQEPDR